MNKKRMAAMVAGGTLAALGIAGTALAAGSDDSAPRKQSTPAVSASATTGLSVSVAAAKEIAVRATGGGLVESVEREVEHGRAVWDVDVLVNGVEHDIDVDAATGVVLRHRVQGASATRHSGTDDRTRTAEPGDDHGGRATTKAAEKGDDHGGRVTAKATEKGDDHGGSGKSGKGGSEKGDDHGSGGHGSDD
ncbi:PepSY domain-containing protein [Actinoplanes sp. NPDC026619]|uniref:PepSY domain-containing protein n=1 Tax=Actinoplanes sp. NPDC026619 TaxID=3155798 RepID=UPI0033F23FE1